jgi:hypothetical protein
MAVKTKHLIGRETNTGRNIRASGLFSSFTMCNDHLRCHIRFMLSSTNVLFKVFWPWVWCSQQGMYLTYKYCSAWIFSDQLFQTNNATSGVAAAVRGRHDNGRQEHKAKSVILKECSTATEIVEKIDRFQFPDTMSLLIVE